MRLIDADKLIESLEDALTRAEVSEIINQQPIITETLADKINKKLLDDYENLARNFRDYRWQNGSVDQAERYQVEKEKLKMANRRINELEKIVSAQESLIDQMQKETDRQ